MERIVYVDKPVEVERIKEVQVERVVTKEVPVEVERIITKEVRSSQWSKRQCCTHLSGHDSMQCSFGYLMRCAFQIDLSTLLAPRILECLRFSF